MGKRDAPFAEDRIVTPRQRADEFMRVGQAGGLLDVLVPRPGSGESDVVAHADSEENVVLEHDANL